MESDGETNLSELNPMLDLSEPDSPVPHQEVQDIANRLESTRRSMVQEMGEGEGKTRG